MLCEELCVIFLVFAELSCEGMLHATLDPAPYSISDC